MDVASKITGNAGSAGSESEFWVPCFEDMAKTSNDIIGKDFYHGAHLLEVKLKAPQDLEVTTKGKAPLGGAISGNVELRKGLIDGVVVTNGWSTGNSLSTKIELSEKVTQGVRLDVSTVFSPEKGSKGNRVAAYFQQPKFYARAFVDHSSTGKLHAAVDGVVGHEGFMAGANAGYDVQKAAITHYDCGFGYSHPSYSASLAITRSFGLVTASYYQRVNSNVEAGLRASYDVKEARTTTMELAAKYRLEEGAFVKAKIDKDGIAAVAYNTKINSGTTLGVGAQFDTVRLNETGPKLGLNLSFKC